MMVQTFKENILETPQQKIDLIFLDSIIAYELKSENLPEIINSCIYQGRQKPVVFPLKTKIMTRPWLLIPSHKG